MDNPRRMCVGCGERTGHMKARKKDGGRIWDKYCRQCKYRPYLKFRKNYCEKCGFMPESYAQMDVHHLDGNHKNNNPINLQTLCANCHRLVSHLAMLDLTRELWPSN